MHRFRAKRKRAPHEKPHFPRHSPLSGRGCGARGRASRRPRPRAAWRSRPFAGLVRRAGPPPAAGVSAKSPAWPPAAAPQALEKARAQRWAQLRSRGGSPRVGFGTPATPGLNFLSVRAGTGGGWWRVMQSAEGQRTGVGSTGSTIPPIWSPGNSGPGLRPRTHQRAGSGPRGAPPPCPALWARGHGLGTGRRTRRPLRTFGSIARSRPGPRRHLPQTRALPGRAPASR